ncbi:hypothetical protein [Sodalis sp. dw_96]|uniref:hypothetical protein n=1 Tax=Sodalis sp. dw_96 TaxID=2719794 RepID=UPI002102EBBB|nr:hypothetical protein [Sodalis sp. dw_96]
MNFLVKITVFLPFSTLVFGCGDKTDQTLSPSENARHVTLLFTIPAGITLMPMQVLYRSDKCMGKSYNSSFESYPVKGYNGFSQPFVRQGHSNTWQTRIAVDGGGSCQWQLNSLRVSFKLSDDNPLVKGKKVIASNYIFDFGDYGLSDGYGTGRAKAVSGNLDLKTNFFPTTIINKMFHETSIELFGGDTDYANWSRRYRLQYTQKIAIEPILHSQKGVLLEGDEERGIGMVITYPDGSIERVRKIKPDYQRLLLQR